MPGPGGHRGGPGGGFGGGRGRMGGMGHMAPPPPPRGGWGFRPYRRGGCCGCLLPVIGIAVLAVGILAMLLF